MFLLFYSLFLSSEVSTLWLYDSDSDSDYDSNSDTGSNPDIGSDSDTGSDTDTDIDIDTGTDAMIVQVLVLIMSRYDVSH